MNVVGLFPLDQVPTPNLNDNRVMPLNNRLHRIRITVERDNKQRSARIVLVEIDDKDEKLENASEEFQWFVIKNWIQFRLAH